MDKMENYLIAMGFLLIFLGIIAIIIGGILSFTSNESKGEIKGGGIVFIGPIPIAFGTDSYSIIIIAILMLMLMFLYFIFFQRL